MKVIQIFVRNSFAGFNFSIQKLDMVFELFLELNATLDQVFTTFRRHKYSRYPIFDESKGEFVGVLHIKDLLLHLSLLEMLPSALKLADLMHPVERVGRHMPLSSLLEQFRMGGSHFALVEEADGKVIGYLTMEDVLEALVGDIQDEHRKAERGILAYQPGKLLVRGDTPLAKVERLLGVDHGAAQADTPERREAEHVHERLPRGRHSGSVEPCPCTTMPSESPTSSRSTCGSSQRAICVV